MNSDQPRLWVVVPAAGKGARMGSDIPKQYLPLANRTVIEHTLECLLQTDFLVGLMVVLAPSDRSFTQLPIAADTKILTCNGGAERAHSVLQGLLALESQVQKGDWVLIHDAARPCLAVPTLNTFVATILATGQGGILAVPVADTLKRVDASAQQILSTQDRTELWQAQTPQMFLYADLLFALQKANACGLVITDEASAMELAGFSCRIVAGTSENLKITQSADLRLASLILQAQKVDGIK